MNFFIITEDIKVVFFSQAKHSNVITLFLSPPPSASPQKCPWYPLLWNCSQLIEPITITDNSGYWYWQLANVFMWQCNLGKVNLEAMLFGSLWTQATHLQPWWFAGTLWDGYMQQPAPAGQLNLGWLRPLAGLLVTPTCNLLLAIIRKAHFAGTFALKLCNFCPAHPPPPLGRCKSLVVGW